MGSSGKHVAAKHIKQPQATDGEGARSRRSHRKAAASGRKAGAKRVISIAAVSLAVLIVAAIAVIAVSGISSIVVKDIAIVEDSSKIQLLTELEDSSLTEITVQPESLEAENAVFSAPMQLVPIYKKAQADENVKNILLICQDGEGSASDIYSLLSFNKSTGNISFMFLLNDTWVNIPDNGWGMLASARSYGGVGLVINTLNSNFDLDIQHYMTVSMEHLIRVIDELGGIELPLTAEEAEYINSQIPGSLPISNGTYNLSGAQSMAHVRSRKIGSGDISRSDRQREALCALVAKAVQNGTDLSGWIKFAHSGLKTNMSLAKLIELYSDVNSCPIITVKQGRLPISDVWHYAESSGIPVIAVDIEQTRELLHEQLYQ